ncbi:type II and III secretion system protein family protein [Vibrio atypicus]|jgi:pilus assembly protein CpaC|uniref:type II and III secretion system protein family protein n=1 Tax=Vibrio atypicus TaxID=558271 RepID=UPI001358905B|nr:pilus assembly protein N-terminal domain-containing protein [Vibrio atypicus]
MYLIKATFTFLILLWSALVSAESLLNLGEGEAKAITTKTEIASVFISNPEIADYQVVDKNKLVIYGKKVGSVSLLAFDDNSQTIISRKLVVNTSLIHVQQQVQLRYPNVDISIYNLGEQVVLAGKVSSDKVRDEINILVGELLAKDYVDHKIEWDLGDDTYEMEFMTRRHYKGIVNNIEVATTKQVNVKLSIAEVSQSFLEEFGVQYASSGYSVGTFVDQLVNFSASDIVSVITALGDDSVGQVLAEPNLSVISGETASFLVGGELPVVTVIDGGTNVLYKEFGIRLELMAKVLEDDKIKLSLMPEVSSLDTQYENERYNLPALKTRRARTTVQLGDGQSFVLGGLLSTEDRESLRRVPFIGDVPILGALFRHSETVRNRTELVIVATVNLVNPVNPSQIQLPTMKRTTTMQRFFNVDYSYTPASKTWAEEVLQTGGFKK